MSRNILLTSLSATENNLPVRYFALQNEFGYDYCDALLDAEAGIKAMLARYNIHEIIIIGGAGSFDSSDTLAPISLRYGNTLYSADKASLSAYGLLQYRIAQYADELSMDQNTEDGLFPEETQKKLIAFINDFQEGHDELKNKKLNRLFDALAQSEEAYEAFCTDLFKAFPEFAENPTPCLQWVKNYLYSELKPSAKLELLPVNEEAIIRFIPEGQLMDSGQMVDNMMTMNDSIVEDEEDINLYISLNSDDVADTYIVMNMIDILVSAPGSVVHLKKIFTAYSLHKRPAGLILDYTDAFGVTELIHAIRAFLNYGRADMIVDIWEKSGERNSSIASMIYAMRHVDVGLSMCNISEMEGGIMRLRELFRSEKLWREFGYYGIMFSIIAESIMADYGPLLEGDGEIPFIEMVEWAYRHQFYQQTLTLIEAKAPENLVNSGIFYYCDDENKAEQVTKLFAQQRLALKPYEYYKMDHIDHYFIKSYDRSRPRNTGGRREDPQRAYASLRTQSVENTDPSLVTGYTACDSTETLNNILYAYYHVGEVRNKISHAEASAMTESRLVVYESDKSSALLWMRESIDFFIESYKKAIAEVKNKKPNVVIISSDSVREAADHMKYKKH